MIDELIARINSKNPCDTHYANMLSGFSSLEALWARYEIGYHLLWVLPRKIIVVSKPTIGVILADILRELSAYDVADLLTLSPMDISDYNNDEEVIDYSDAVLHAVSDLTEKYKARGYTLPYTSVALAHTIKRHIPTLQVCTE